MSDWDLIEAEVWYNAKTYELVILGMPEGFVGHNCDVMGCGQQHVLWRTFVLQQEASDDAREDMANEAHG